MKNIWTRLLIIVSLATLVMGQPVAAAVNNGATYSIASNKIKKWPQAADISSETGVLMDADTGVVLFDKGKDETRYPASITKVMTCLLALEHSRMSDKVTFTATALARMEEGTNINCQVGEEMTMDQLVHVLMIKSANEVAAQIAEYVGGSQEKFIDMMNKKAAELGCSNTHFANPSGLPDENHWTTAQDMATIFQAALKNKEFVKIISTLSYTVPPTNKTAEARTLTCHHAMVVPSAPEYYQGVIGGKTGVTSVAKSTLVTGAERNGMKLICVVMRAESHGAACQDTTALFNYGFSNFEKIKVRGGSVTVPKGVKVKGLQLTSGQSEDGGFVDRYTYNDYCVGVASMTGAQIKAEEEAKKEKAEAQAKAKTEAQAKEAASAQASAEAVARAADKEVRDDFLGVARVLALLIFALLMLIIIRLVTNAMYGGKKKKGKKRKKKEGNQKTGSASKRS